MAYWYLDKQTKEARIFGSITSLCKHAGLKKDAMYYHFTRNKKKEVENDLYRIVKTKIERGS